MRYLLNEEVKAIDSIAEILGWSKKKAKGLLQKMPLAKLLDVDTSEAPELTPEDKKKLQAAHTLATMS